MKNILLTLFTTVFVNCIAQNITLSTDTLEWRTAKPFSWDEFKGTQPQINTSTGDACFTIYATYKRLTAFSEVRYTIMAVADRKQSWINPEAKNKNTLSYYQTMFDLYELHARKMRKDVLTIDDGNDIGTPFQAKYENAIAAVNSDKELFKQETKAGTDAKQLKKWKVKIAKELKELEAFKK